MSNYEEWLGLEYIEGRQDCFSILRGYCEQTYGLEIPNFARPTRFWEDPSLDLYGMYASQGFVQVFDRPIELGDVLLMPIRTAMNSHAAMVVADNLILHHFPGRLSSVESLRPTWANRTTVIIRHPRITAFHRQTTKPVSFNEVINVHVLEASAAERGTPRSVDP